jgi:hypothetical protein
MIDDLDMMGGVASTLDPDSSIAMFCTDSYVQCRTKLLRLKVTSRPKSKSG